jgi:TatD DNase family protein
MIPVPSGVGITCCIEGLLYVCTRLEKMFTDSHTHLYLKAFEEDQDQMIKRAVEAGVTRMFLPNIDSHSTRSMFSLAELYPDNCFPMMGLHPTSVKENFRDELGIIEKLLDHPGIIGIGETGIDLYWDKTFLAEQEIVFKTQIGWAKELGLPIVIHARNSFAEIFRVMDEAGTEGLRGVFHSFTGGSDELQKALSYGFMIGINGIVTFKNSDLDSVVRSIPAENLLLETDAPFLAPVPHRGKRNESSYLLHIAARVGEIHNLNVEEVGAITTNNALGLFQISSPHGI